MRDGGPEGGEKIDHNSLVQINLNAVTSAAVIIMSA